MIPHYGFNCTLNPYPLHGVGSSCCSHSLSAREIFHIEDSGDKPEPAQRSKVNQEEHEVHEERMTWRRKIL